jgi:hypothetical protein
MGDTGGFDYVRLVEGIEAADVEVASSWDAVDPPHCSEDVTVGWQPKENDGSFFVGLVWSVKLPLPMVSLRALCSMGKNPCGAD